MSLKELEQNIIKLSSEIKEEKVVCRIDNIRSKFDKYGRKVLQIFAYCSNYNTVVFNYSPQKAKLLVESLRKLGFGEGDTVIGRCFELKRERVEKVRADYTEPYPVFLPLKIIDCNYVV